MVPFPSVYLLTKLPGAHAQGTWQGVDHILIAYKPTIDRSLYNFHNLQKYRACFPNIFQHYAILGAEVIDNI